MKELINKYWRHPGGSRGPEAHSTSAGRTVLWVPAFAGMTLLFILTAFAYADPPPATDPALCRALVKHTPAPDVAYQPGVDVHGKPVAPADFPGQPQMQLPSHIDIPLTVSLTKALNLNTSQYPYNQLGPGTEAQLGTISVEGDRVTYNGQPLTDAQQDNLAVLCMKPTSAPAR